MHGATIKIGKIIFLYILIFKFMDSKLEGIRFCTYRTYKAYIYIYRIYSRNSRHRVIHAFNTIFKKLQV